MNDRWLTGREVLENYGLQVFELASLLEGGLPAYEPGTGNRYISPKDCKKIGEVLSKGELMERHGLAIKQMVSAGFEGLGISIDDTDLYSKQVEKCLAKIAESPHPPEKHTVLDFQVHPKSTKYEGWLATITAALFLPADVEEVAAPLKGGPPPSERIADLERQLAEARQENDALRAEVMKLRTEATEIEDAASVDPPTLTKVQARCLMALLQQNAGRTVGQIGEDLHPDTPPDSQERVVRRDLALARSMLTPTDNTRP